MAKSGSRIITLTTDFGLTDGYVGAMKGAVLSVNSECTVVDVSHSVSPQDVAGGARVLMSACPFFPLGTVHVAVVDPGVGTQRAAVAVKAGGHYFVGPDNGLLSPVVELMGLEAVHQLDDVRFFRDDVSTTFHGRDVFGPVAGHLSTGVAIERLGPVCKLKRLPAASSAQVSGDGVVLGAVTHVDHFGNLITNIARAQLPELPVTVTFSGHCEAPLVHTYGDAITGKIVALVGSSGLLELALPNGSAAQSLQAGAGLIVEVRRK